MKTTYYSLSTTLEARVVDIPPKIVTKPAIVSANHVIMIDVSGSMTGNLRQLREHLKNKVAQMMREGDTLSIIWFSGRGEFGTIFEGVEVRDLRELKSVHDAIDRWLRPVGATGFVEPIRELTKVVRKISSNGKPVNSFFLSDGGENCWPRSEVFKAITESLDGLATSTVVEYGYYADRAFLAEMASRWGGAHIFAENFEAYQPMIEAALTRQVIGGPRFVLDLGDVEAGIAVAVNQGEVVAYNVENGKVTLPEGTSQVAYLSKSVGGNSVPDPRTFQHDAALFALVAALAPRVRSDLIWPLLKKLGDVKLIKAYSNCFGKQAYSAFQALATAGALADDARYQEGFNPNLVPVEDAYTILDLLHDLEDSDARIDFDHPDFKYARIGRTRVDANTRLTEEEEEELKKLTAEMAATKDVTVIKAIQSRITALTNKPEPLKFVPEPPRSEMERGYSIDGLVSNEDRPNISFRVNRPGSVDISSRLANRKDLADKIPAVFPTYQFRNYTVIRDGIINIAALPVVNLAPSHDFKLASLVSQGKLSHEAYYRSVSNGLSTWVFDLTKIPIINQQMINQVSAESLFRQEWEKLKYQAQLKVLKHEYKQLYDKKSAGFSALYGKEGGEFLAELGIVDYSGFNPRVLQTESTDFYMAKVLEVKIKGYSTLPPVDKVREMMAAKKLNGPGKLMEPMIKLVDKQLAKNPPDLRAWFEEQMKEYTQQVRKWQREEAVQKYGIIVGQMWFKEFKTLDDKTMKLRIDNLDLDFTAELSEKKETI